MSVSRAWYIYLHRYTKSHKYIKLQWYSSFAVFAIRFRKRAKVSSCHGKLSIYNSAKGCEIHKLCHTCLSLQRELLLRWRNWKIRNASSMHRINMFSHVLSIKPYIHLLFVYYFLWNEMKYISKEWQQFEDLCVFLHISKQSLDMKR